MATKIHVSKMSTGLRIHVVLLSPMHHTRLGSMVTLSVFDPSIISKTVNHQTYIHPTPPSPTPHLKHAKQLKENM